MLMHCYSFQKETKCCANYMRLVECGKSHANVAVRIKYQVDKGHDFEALLARIKYIRVAKGNKLYKFVVY